MERACEWEARHGMLVGLSPRRTRVRSMVGLAVAGLVLLVPAVFVAAHAVEVALAGDWNDRVCRSVGSRGCGPAWLSLSAALFFMVVGAGFGVGAVRELSKREHAFALERDDFRVVFRNSSTHVPEWVRVRWADLAEVVPDGGRLDLVLREGASATHLDGRTAGPLTDLLCGDARADAAVLRHFRTADRRRIGQAPAQDEANRIAADTP